MFQVAVYEPLTSGSNQYLSSYQSEGVRMCPIAFTCSSRFTEGCHLQK